MMGIVRFTPALLADNLDQVLPRGWRGEKFVGWGGGSSAAGSGGPSATWLSLFWNEVSLLDVASVPGLGQWPLVPITTGELVSCSMLQQVGCGRWNGEAGGEMRAFKTTAGEIGLHRLGICGRSDYCYFNFFSTL